MGIDVVLVIGAGAALVAGSVLLLVIGAAFLVTGYRHARAWRRARERG